MVIAIIAIIAILAAILFPVFARARENARRASCQSNVKQILLGVFQYTQDYDEKYPQAHNEGGTQPDNQKGWFNTLQPYLKSTQILQCPSDSGTENATRATYHVSYIVNANFGAGGGSVSLAQVENTATTVYMADGSKQSNGTTILPAGAEKNGGLRLLQAANGAEAMKDASATGDGNWGGPNPRHLETAVFGFADGHVKSGKVTSYYGASGTAKGACLDPAVGCL